MMVLATSVAWDRERAISFLASRHDSWRTLRQAQGDIRMGGSGWGSVGDRVEEPAGFGAGFAVEVEDGAAAVVDLDLVPLAGEIEAPGARPRGPPGGEYGSYAE